MTESGIFARLTDPSLYTGAHKQRFDETGKGRGKAGREDVKDSTGYVSGFKNEKATTKTASPVAPKDQQVLDRLTNPALYTGAHKQRFDDSGKGKGKAGREETKKDDGYVTGFKRENATTATTTPLSKKEEDVLSRLTNPSLYTGAHKHRFDESGKGRGKAGREDLTSKDGYVSGFTRDATPSPEPTKSNIFDRLTDTKLYTGAHKARFDSEGHGLGVNQTVDKESPKSLSDQVNRDAKARPKPRAGTATGASKAKAASPARSPSPGGSSIFDRLADPRSFTGAQKARATSAGSSGAASSVRAPASRSASARVLADSEEPREDAAEEEEQEAQAPAEDEEQQE